MRKVFRKKVKYSNTLLGEHILRKLHVLIVERKVQVSKKV